MNLWKIASSLKFAPFLVRKPNLELMNMPTNDASDRIDQAIALLRQHSIKVVTFDMDQTAVAMHSRGRLSRTKLDHYLDLATPDFVQLIPRLHREGFGLCIATHSDEAEFGGFI